MKFKTTRAPRVRAGLRSLQWFALYRVLIFLIWPLFKEGPLTTSNQLLSPYTVALRLR